MGPFAETLGEMTVGRRARYGPCVPINGTSKNLLAQKKHRRRHLKLVYLVGSPSSPKALPQLLVYVYSMLYFNLSIFFWKGDESYMGAIFMYVSGMADVRWANYIVSQSTF